MMTEYEALSLSILSGGFVLTLGGIIVAITRAVGKIKEDADKRVTEAQAVLALQHTDFNSSIATVETSLRQSISDNEKKLLKVEIWVRDHFATKPEMADIIGAATALADLTKDVRHNKGNLEQHTLIYRELSDSVIRLQKDVERLVKIVNGK